MEYNNEIYDNLDSESDEVGKKRKIVVPGEIIVSGEDFLPGEGTRREGNDVLASRFGIAEEMGRVVKVIQVTGAYVPRKNNVVVGRVADITFSGWLIDIDTPTSGFLSIEEFPRYINKNEMERYMGIGDVVAVKIWNVKSKGIDLSLKGKGLGKLEGGFVFKVIPSRVPRIIGKEGSMIGLIKEKTKCNVSVGQNGWVWINGETIDSEILARKAIEFVNENVHVNGLTDKMGEWFEKNGI